MRYLICYDIQSSRRRTRLARLLLDYGDRVQLSAYEAELTGEELAELLRRAAPHVTERDSLRVYPLCAQCSDKLRTLGRTPTPPPRFRYL